MKIETKEKIEIFKQVVKGLFTLLIGVSILLAAISLYNHFKSPEVGDKPKEPQVSEPEVSECDCEKYVNETISAFGESKVDEWSKGGAFIKSYKWCDYEFFGNKVKDLVSVGGVEASEKVKDCDKK